MTTSESDEFRRVRGAPLDVQLCKSECECGDQVAHRRGGAGSGTAVVHTALVVVGIDRVTATASEMVRFFF